ncbi:MAG: preprotein translocase subunit SecE [Bacteroidales bacterium]|nr:preprotein translocase subunit SecE [Bacteroidales bacterium]MCL2133576.1 preprotein translocase subunit SecE [Bacteroidales bacterium]
MKKIKSYFQEAYNELAHKVTWPSWSQLQSSAVVVMVASCIMALVIFAMDFTFREFMTFIYKLLY